MFEKNIERIVECNEQTSGRRSSINHIHFIHGILKMHSHIKKREREDEYQYFKVSLMHIILLDNVGVFLHNSIE